MLKEAELSTTYTGLSYLGEETGSVSGSYTFTTSSSVNLPYSRKEVVRESTSSLCAQSDVCPDTFLNELTLKPTGSELSDFTLLLVLYRHQTISVTDYRITYLPARLPVKSSTPAFLPVETLATETPAEHLRAISGLEVELLASIFPVSRTAYHKWINGSAPNRKHREHLLEVLSLVEKAVQRFGSQSAMATWLLTPISATGKKPIEYLATQQYSVFRGFLLRVPTGQEVVRPATPSSRVHRELSKEEVEGALERLRPRAWVEDDDKE